MENNGVAMDVELFVSTVKTTTINVRVTAPRYTGSTIDEQFTVTSGMVKQLYFPPGIRNTGTSLKSNAILVSADDEVSTTFPK